jgi:hypothetical protein
MIAVSKSKLDKALPGFDKPLKMRPVGLFQLFKYVGDTLNADELLHLFAGLACG